ncbi:MAG: hypothetical protein V3T19_02055 [Acidiferrobacterales bacterium]
MIRDKFRSLLLFSLLLCLTPGIRAAFAADQSFEARFESIVDQLNKGSKEEFIEDLDVDAILQRAFDGLDLDPGVRSRFANNVIRGKKNIVSSFVRRTPEGSYTKLLKVRVNGDRATALVRYDLGRLGYGYHQYELVKDDAGNIRIVDWLDYTAGRTYSEMLRQSVVTYDPTESSVRGLVKSYDGNDKSYARLAELMQAVRDKDFSSYKRIEPSLDRSLRYSLFMHLLNCDIGKMSRDQNQYNNAYRKLENNFGDNPALALMLMNYRISKGDFDDLGDSLRQLQQAFGVRDAAVLLLMSRAALGSRHTDDAAVLADEAISIEPQLESAYWAAINAHVLLQHYSFAVSTARSLEDQFDKSLERELFEKNGRYANFVKSPQYEQWQAGNE